MGFYDDSGNWRPGRVNFLRRKCLVCGVVFEAGHVPADGVCRKCRAPGSPQPPLISELELKT